MRRAHRVACLFVEAHHAWPARRFALCTRDSRHHSLATIKRQGAVHQFRVTTPRGARQDTCAHDSAAWAPGRGAETLVPRRTSKRNQKELKFHRCSETDLQLSTARTVNQHTGTLESLCWMMNAPLRAPAEFWPKGADFCTASTNKFRTFYLLVTLLRAGLQDGVAMPNGGRGDHGKRAPCAPWPQPAHAYWVRQGRLILASIRSQYFAAHATQTGASAAAVAAAGLAASGTVGVAAMYSPTKANSLRL